MVEKTNAKGAPAGPAHPPPDEEVYSTLGALLGTLEVVATDDISPLARVHAERLEAALRLCDMLQHQIEALLTLANEDLAAQLKRVRCVLRPLLEHAVQGARRCLEQYAVELRMPGGREWGQERVLIDNSRVDRMLRVLTETLVRGVGQGGRLELRLKRAREPVAKARAASRGRGVGARAALGEPFITIELAGAPLGDPSVAQQPFAGGLLERAARRLFELHGGSLQLDREQLALSISLPLVEAP